MDKSRPIIDLTKTYQHINWPRTNTIIELLDDSIGDEYPVSPRNNRSRLNRSYEENIASNIEDTSVGPPNKRRKPGPKPKKNTVAKLSTKDNHNRDRSRSPICFGECPICCEELGKNPLASTKCGHVYCIKCLEQSLKIDRRCPTCRVGLKGRGGYHPLYISKK